MVALTLLFVLACVASGASAFEIEAMKHDIQVITASKFDGIIGKFRDNTISSLWLFKDDNAADKKFLDEYNNLAKDMKGMAKICALNCNDWPEFCRKSDVKETPAVMIYPTNPMPAFLFQGKMEAKAIAGKISKLIPDFGVKLADKESVDAFLSSDPSKPKVLLFSNKKSPPTIFKALSSETVFQRSAKFGFVSEDNAEACKRFNVKKFPTFIMQRGTKSEIKDTYSGEMTFGAIAAWVNLHSESGMGDKVKSTGTVQEESIEEAKPWLVQEVPELTAKSSNDICFKGEGLCVIYLKDGELSQEETTMLTTLSKKFTSQLSDRGAKMKWMWMNLAIENGFKTLFEPTQLPSAVVFNPHKRLRFAKMDHGEDNDVKGDEAALGNLMDKVLGGDARFKMVPGQKLPTWQTRDDASKKKQEL